LLHGCIVEHNQLLADASTHRDAGRYSASLALIGRGLAATPDDPELLLARASTLFAWRRCQEARVNCLRAEALGLRSTELYLQLGWSCFGAGNLDEAEAAMRKAAATDPGSWQTHFNLAVVLQAQKRFDEAAASYERALEDDTDDFDCHIGLGNCLLRQGDAVAAEIQFHNAIAVDEQRATAWTHLGMAIVRHHLYAKALEAFAHADMLDERNGEDADSFVGLAIALAEDGRSQEALALHQMRLPRRPAVEGHYAYALALLKAGRFAEGWHHYEFRWLRESLPWFRPDFQRPAWAGQDLRGKTILLHVEQGFGDLIQFVRYVPHVKALGATVILRVPRAMKNLARKVPATDWIVDRDEPIPEFDFYIYLLSLPRVFGTDLASIPADIPYLQAEPERVERWAKRLGPRDALRVGLTWAGSPTHSRDRYRSVPLRMLAPLWGVAGVRFISLQKGPAVAEVATLAADVGFVNLGPELEDFCDTAAVISELDLVLCVDTAVAHLAGALGKPVWLMLPQPADFRWMEGREDSPWYPTMRLFRQSRRDHWEDVVERVQAALQERLQGGVAATLTHSDALVAPRPLPRPPAVVRAGIPAGHRPGFSAVTETRVGILQYLPDEAWVGESLGWYGEYLQPQLDLLGRLMRPGMTVLEADAGIGAHAVFLGKAVGAAGHLFLYEPRPVVQRILRQNLGANRVTNVTLMRRALGRPGEAKRAAPEGPAQTAAAGAASRVVTETLDELQLERLDWLKLNEGTLALEVLAGAEEMLWRLRPLLFMAAADEPVLTALVHRAQAFSYRCWRMETALFNPQNFNRRDTDIFAGRTARALLAIPEEIDVDIALDECVELS
jgi:FkbM family methyltransferase